MSQQALEWITPGEAPFTVFYQGTALIGYNIAYLIACKGIFCSQTQLAKYTGPKGFISTAGDTVVCKNGIETVYKPFVGKEIDTIILKKNNPKNTSSCCSIAPAVHYITNWRYNYVYGVTVKQQEDQKETVDAHQMDFFKASFGQEVDLKNHKEKYNLCMKKNGGADVILFGCSRGAATTWNAMCLHKYPNVKLVILEGIFHSVADLLATSVPYGHETVHALMPYLFPKYDPKGPAPGSLVDQFPPGVPVVFISSKIDKVVPFSSTLKLANALAKRQKNEVYFINLTASSHPYYPLSNQDDKNAYAYGLHAIYKIHDLPHNVEYARLGKDIPVRF